MLRLWRVKLLDPISIEQYYAPVPQVDRGLSGHLGAGVPLQVADVTRTFSNLKKKDSALYTSLYYLLLQLSLKSLHSSSISDIILGEDHLALAQGQEEEPEGG